MEKQLEAYFELQQEIYSYFGYGEDWCIFPIQDNTEMYWYWIEGDVNIRFSELEGDLQDGEGNHYEDEVYHQRFLPKAVYKGPEFTMFVVDTHTDGNKLLRVFKNSMRVDRRSVSTAVANDC